MRIKEKTKFSDLRIKYDYIIGWGAANGEFEKRYTPFMYKLDYMIDNFRDEDIICGTKIFKKTVLEDIDKRSNICFVIFPNLEEVITEDIKACGFEQYDTIVSRLLVAEGYETRRSYSQMGEDIIIMDVVRQLNLISPYYIDIGVCHPVIRNNTYMLYENGFKEGLLIEPNIDMCNLARDYRPDNTIIEAGACGKNVGDGGSMKYYTHPNLSYCGHNTFNEEEAKKGGFSDNYRIVPVYNINDILSKHLLREPDIIDIDVEGWDLDIMEELDTNKFRAKFICIEEFGRVKKVRELMTQKGYVHFGANNLNGMYIAKELLGF